jgi:23S rRNA G2069 N7-methylase RlmK/C1962 C5-methylase RlmI
MTTDPRLSMLLGRLKKNEARLGPWRRREQVSCYRAYDRDMPELPIALDVYRGDADACLIATGWAPRHGGGAAFAELVAACGAAAAPVLDVNAANVFVQIREPGRGGELDADDVDASAQEITVNEGPGRFLLRLGARRDPGLFLDHRTTRKIVADDVKGRRLLNLFAYTGSFSVLAGLAGARSTLSVDLSVSTCRWAEENLQRNGLDPAAHRVVVADALAFLDDADDDVGPFDVIVIDPPSFSKSRRAASTFEVQRDHPRLIASAIARLAPGGVIWFSCNLRDFHFDMSLAEKHGVVVDDWTSRTTPIDFRGTPHHCVRVQRNKR